MAAQSQSASERRLARQKNESNVKEFEGEDPLFKSAEIPAKWTNRSAVIIGERVEFTFGTNSSYGLSVKVRRQVKLLDQAAVEEFGYYIYDEDEDNRTGLQILKKDGEKVIIDMSTAALFKEEVSSRRVRQWNNYVRGGKNRRKVALPGLQVGDVVDMIYESKSRLQNLFYPSCSDVFDVSFASDYPILRKDVQFTVRKGASIAANSLNGAPELKLISEEGGKYQTYMANAEMLDDDTLTNRYAYYHRTQPHIKLQVCVLAGKKSIWDEFTGASGEVKRYVSDDEIQEVIANAHMFRFYNRTVSIGKTTYYRFRDPQVGGPYVRDYKGWLKRNFRDESDPIKVADALYFHMRYDFLHGKYSENAKFMNDELFATMFVGALHAHNKTWKVELIVGPGRNITDRKNLMSREELYWVASVSHKGKKHLYYTLSDHRKPGDSFYRLAGVEGQVVYIHEKRAKGEPIEKFRFPEEKAADHGMSYSADISINDKNELQFVVKTSFFGNSRFIGSDYFLSNKDFSKEEIALVRSTSKEQQKKSASEIRRTKKVEVTKDFDREENERKKLEKLKNRVENGYKLVSYDGYEILQSGRMPNVKELVVSENYVVSDLVSKAGSNLIVSIGLLPGEFGRIDTSLQGCLT